MPKKKEDNFPFFMGGRKPLSRKEKSMVVFGFLCGTIGALIAVVIFGKDHTNLALLVMALSVIIGIILGAQVSSLNK